MTELSAVHDRATLTCMDTNTATRLHYVTDPRTVPFEGRTLLLVECVAHDGRTAVAVEATGHGREHVGTCPGCNGPVRATVDNGKAINTVARYESFLDQARIHKSADPMGWVRYRG